MKRIICAVVVLLALAGPAGAGFDEGWAAYERGDYATALREFRPLAGQGDAYAQFNLGYMYSNGRGVPQDYVQAMRWYRKAAEQGDADAQFNLGIMYSKGQGVPHDYVQAVRWYRKAAEQGYASAQINLGYMYFKGWGVPQDYIQAHIWFNLAASRAENGEVRDNAVKNRDIVAGHMTPAQVAEAQRLARAWRPKKQVAATSSRPDAGGATDDRQRIVRVQRGLASLGYDPGPADGIMGGKTRAAIRAFQSKMGLPVTGEISKGLESAIRSAKRAVASTRPTTENPVEDIEAQIQESYRTRLY